MSLSANLKLLAAYNQTMNTRLYELAQALPVATLTADKGAFFGSIQATLNHLLVADLIWLNRFAKFSRPFPALALLAQFPLPSALDQMLYSDFGEQSDRRRQLDDAIRAFTDDLSDTDLAADLHYRNTKGLPFTRNFGSVLLHFFNHQTHHRGQVTTLLSQCGVDVGVTDFLVMIPETAPAT